MTDEQMIERLKNIRKNCTGEDDEALTWAIECVKHAGKQWCKFRSEKNCDFCSFHSDCDIHWKGGDK